VCCKWSQWVGLNHRPTVYETVFAISRLRDKLARQPHQYSANQCSQASGEFVAKTHVYALLLLQTVARKPMRFREPLALCACPVRSVALYCTRERPLNSRPAR